MNAHVELAADPWSPWREALAARKPVDAPKGVIAFGYYRARDGEAIAFWDEEGSTVCWRSGQFPAPRHADAMLDLFARVSPYPVAHEAFVAYCDTGLWPDQVAPVEVAADLPPHERAQALISAQRDAMAEWLKSIGGAVTTQEHASKAGNFADEFAKLEKAASAQHKAEKQPVLDKGREIDGAWKPVIERADELKRWAKKSTEAFLIAERARIAAEERAAAEARAKAAREAEEVRRAAELAGAPPPAPAPPPLPAPPPAKAKAGKVHLRTETIYEVESPAEFLHWLAGQNNLPEDFLAALKTLGSRMAKAGIVPDGVVAKTVERAA
jgi:hypothetical protein